MTVMETPNPVVITPNPVVTVRYSHYWPPLLGPNCSRAVGGVCVARMASGLRWQDWVGRAVACPPEWPFGTRVVLDGAEWTCQDRGGKIQFVDGLPWVDFLTAVPAYRYGELVDTQVIFP